MGFCSDNERFAQARREYAKLKQQQKLSVLDSYHEEHQWRVAGEAAIRREMERRLDVYYIKKRRA